MDARRRCDRADGGRRATGKVIALAAVLVLTLCLLTGSASAATYKLWESQKSGTTRALYGVTFVTTDQGWAVGASGAIRHTVNGGSAWGGQTSGVTRSLRDVAFTDADTGWIVGDSGVILHTVNGGAKWTKQVSGTTNALYAVFMADGLHGWAVGARGTIVATVDGGTTWKPQPSGTTQTLHGVAFTSGTDGWVVGAKGVQLQTVSAGTTWTSQNAGKNLTIYAVLFSDATTGWEVGSGGGIRHTDNGGSSWKVLASGTRAALYDLAANVAGDAWTVGAGGLVRYTDDAGATWTTQASGTTVNLRAIARAGRNLYAVGDGGAIVASIADIVAPVTTATGLQVDDHTGWTNTGVDVTLTATDGRSGVAATYYTLDGSAPLTYAAPFTVTLAGQHEVTYWSEDNAGNVEDVSTGWINIDTSAPTVSDGADALWHNSDVTVQLTPADTGGSGPARTEYRLQGEADWRPTTADAFTVAAPGDGTNDGAHVYEYRALDVAGNASLTGTCTVKIDATPAVTTADGLFDELTGWSQGARTVTLGATDALSGVVATYCTVDAGGQQTYVGPFVVSGTGQHPVTYWSVDGAGNVEAVRTGWVNIATLYAEATGLAPDTHSHWRNTAAAVTVTGGGDNGPFTIVYQIDGGDWVTVDSPASFTVAGVGNHTVVYYARDSLAGESAPLTGHVNIETTPPVTLRGAIPAGWTRLDVSVSLQPGDDLSGVAVTWWRVDGGSWASGETVTVPALPDHTMDGPRTVSYYSVDNAGNQEAAEHFVVRIDTRRPVTKAPYPASVLRNHYATLKCKIVDVRPCAAKATLKIVVKNSHGVVKWRHTYLNSKVNYRLSKRFLCKLPRGTYRFLVYATDRAGNTQSKIGSNRLTVR